MPHHEHFDNKLKDKDHYTNQKRRQTQPKQESRKNHSDKSAQNTVKTPLADMYGIQTLHNGQAGNRNPVRVFKFKKSPTASDSDINTPVITDSLKLEYFFLGVLATCGFNGIRTLAYKL